LGFTANVSIGPSDRVTISFFIAVIVLNVLSYFSPLREQLKKGISEGFISPENDNLIVFIDGPLDPSLFAHETFDWGKAAVEALDSWQPSDVKSSSFDWTMTIEGESREKLDAL